MGLPRSHLEVLLHASSFQGRIGSVYELGILSTTQCLLLVFKAVLLNVRYFI